MPLENSTILELCCGGGHLVKGMIDYCSYTYDSKLWRIIATDIKKRDSVLRDCDFRAGQEYDFLSDNYPYTENIDYIITNPPYSVIEPFVMKSLGIANKGVLILGRLQFIEGKNRYEKIFKECPPTDVYAYINRINCVKNGDFSISSSSVQAYAWFYWDLANTSKETRLHWIWRID